jgi:large subunit ribosomal protein L25
MQTFDIKGSVREKTGKKYAASLRSQGQVPCVMYGGDEIIHFYSHENNFHNLVYTSNVFLVNLDLDGTRHEAILQDIQFHPVTDKVIHVDFIRVLKDRKIIMKLPVRLTGVSAGLLSGGKLRQRRRYIRVRGLIDHIPDHLEIDITNLDVGHYIKIGDLKFDELEILDPPRAMVVGIVSSRLVAKGLQVTEEEAEAAAAHEVEKPEAEGETEESES